MSTNKKLAVFAAGIAILFAPMAGALAESRTHRGHVVKGARYRPVRVASDSGWRHRSTKGWDNTCHNVPYLINMHACSR